MVWHGLLQTLFARWPGNSPWPMAHFGPWNLVCNIVGEAFCTSPTRRSRYPRLNWGPVRVRQQVVWCNLLPYLLQHGSCAMAVCKYPLALKCTIVQLFATTSMLKPFSLHANAQCREPPSMIH